MESVPSWVWELVKDIGPSHGLLDHNDNICELPVIVSAAVAEDPPLQNVPPLLDTIMAPSHGSTNTLMYLPILATSVGPLPSGSRIIKLKSLCFRLRLNQCMPLLFSLSLNLNLPTPRKRLQLRERIIPLGRQKLPDPRLENAQVMGYLNLL